MATVVNSVGRMFLVFSNVRTTSAKLAFLRLLVPLKMMFSIFSLRSLRVFCSPSTQRMESTILLLPQPLGPTMPVIPLSKRKSVLSAKLLKPCISRLLSCISGGAVLHLPYEGRNCHRHRHRLVRATRHRPSH